MPERADVGERALWSCAGTQLDHHGQQPCVSELLLDLQLAPGSGFLLPGCLRFLQDRKLDVEEAEEKLLKMLRWRREFGCVA